MTSSRARFAGATVSAALCGTAALLAPASDAKGGGGDAVVIKMVQDGKTFAFKGPSKIAKGAELTFVNQTDVRKGGPHTASVVDPSLLPKNGAEQKACGKNLTGLCGLIAFDGHDIDTKTFEVARPDVDVGKTGWDQEFGKKGDTWYSETIDETETRKVTAKAGTTLTFFCAVHPEMVKKLRVK